MNRDKHFSLQLEVGRVAQEADYEMLDWVGSQISPFDRLKRFVERTQTQLVQSAHQLAKFVLSRVDLQQGLQAAESDLEAAAVDLLQNGSVQFETINVALNLRPPLLIKHILHFLGAVDSLERLTGCTLGLLKVLQDVLV